MQTYLQQAHQSLQMQHVRFSQMCKMTALFLNQDCKSLSFVNKKEGEIKLLDWRTFGFQNGNYKEYIMIS